MKRTLPVLEVLLVLLVSREAQAFYNSPPGRGISRDPIGEKGGRDLYEFAYNYGIK